MHAKQALKGFDSLRELGSRNVHRVGSAAMVSSFGLALFNLTGMWKWRQIAPKTESALCILLECVRKIRVEQRIAFR